MIRRSVFFLCNALQNIPEPVPLAKDYRKIEATRKEIEAAEKKKREFESYPLRYQVLDCPPGLPLALTKLKYLIACRRTHPDAGGDPESFLRVSLAYQDVMKDYGVETVDNQIVNLGNFQTDSSEVQNYLEARAQIKSYIPISTLEDHILKLEEVQKRLGDDVVAKLSANNDDSMWLLEDIEDIMEQSGLKTVRLHMLEDGQVKPAETLSLTDGTEKPLFLPPEDLPAAAAEETKGDSADQSAGADSAADPRGPAEDAHAGQGAPEEADSEQRSAGDAVAATSGEQPKVVQTVEVSSSDIEVLNAKHNVQQRKDVAGLASRTATEVMSNTKEMAEFRIELVVFICMSGAIFFALYAYLDSKARAKSSKDARPQAAEHIQEDTMLPWWGNDAEYESQVKRIFVDEWRRARSSSQRTQTQQAGIARESLDDATKAAMDLEIFTVTAEKLREMREHAAKHPGRQ